MDGIDGLEPLVKKGPYIGPRGGRYEDPQHKIPYHQAGAKAPEHAILEHARAAVRAEQKAAKEAKKKKWKKRFGLGKSMDSIDGLAALAKGGPFIGPRGGKWADAKHTIPYHEESGWTPGAKSDRKARAQLEQKVWDALPPSNKGTENGEKTVYTSVGEGANQRTIKNKLSSFSDKGLKAQLEKYKGYKAAAAKTKGGEKWDSKEGAGSPASGMKKEYADVSSRNAAREHAKSLSDAIRSLTDPTKKTKDKTPDSGTLVPVLNGIIRDVRNGTLSPAHRNALKTQINQSLKNARVHYKNMYQRSYQRQPKNPDRHVTSADVNAARRLRDNLAHTAKILGGGSAKKKKAGLSPKERAGFARDAGRMAMDRMAEHKEKTATGGLSAKDPLDAWRKKKAEMGNKSMDAIDDLEALIKAKYLKRERKGNRFVYTYADDRRRPKKKGKKLSPEQAKALMRRGQANAESGALAAIRQEFKDMFGDNPPTNAEIKKLAARRGPGSKWEKYIGMGVDKPVKPAKKKSAPAPLPQGFAKTRVKGKTSYYADTSIIQGARKALPNWEVKHMGFGEFYLSGPDGGRIDFARRDGAGVISNPSGREHLMYDNAGGKHVRKLVSGYRKVEKAEAAIRAKLPADVATKPEYERASMARSLHDDALTALNAGKYASAIEAVQRAKAVLPEDAEFYGSELARIQLLSRKSGLGTPDQYLDKEPPPANRPSPRDAYGLTGSEEIALENQQDYREKSADALAGLEALAKGGDITQDLIHGKYKMMAKMSKKQRKVAADVMQQLMGKMSNDADVTQKLLGKCNDTKKSYFEPTLKKGMYGFQETPKNKIPDNLLREYLMAFIEEAYEHEKRECEHKQSKPTGQREELDFFAGLVMNELVTCMGNNTELARAAEGVTKETIAALLNNSGLIQPQVSGYVPTDADNFEAMLRAKPFIGEELSKGIAPPERAAHDPGRADFIDDTVDPFQALHAHQVAAQRVAYQGAEIEYVAKGDGHCPIHGYGDLTKMVNLAHPYGKCICS